MKTVIVFCLFLLIVPGFGISKEIGSGDLPEIEGFGAESLTLAARNIVAKVTGSPAGTVAVICSEQKEDLAAWIVHELVLQDIGYIFFTFADKSPSNLDRITACIRDSAGKQGLIFLIHPADAAFLFEQVGRPDTGIKIPEGYFFCDWIMTTPSLIRLYDADAAELDRFRDTLLTGLRDARKIRVVTDRGTDITVTPRSWIIADGEVYTAPVETETNGTIFVDGCAYGGPPAKPFFLRITGGRVVNLADLDTGDKQQSMVCKDMTRDGNSNVLAELGIGTSINSRWDAYLMEAEQARGTCHFGFGRNVDFEGGRNDSGYHFDLVIRKPTIYVDGICICKDGEYGF